MLTPTHPDRFLDLQLHLPATAAKSAQGYVVVALLSESPTSIIGPLDSHIIWIRKWGTRS
ncbi:hypothetical protein Mal48_23780 [Thalassoglobus polymorphus]|uniref:Uncharacterized protein n=1 Tax=Thalassoglobus polymorphus TaxID=2527994 RepID=A0A517QNB4_9PLAN|nr:hypothetical protein Mal48_23780 [Thalassoglobus polymorphus]